MAHRVRRFPRAPALKTWAGQGTFSAFGSDLAGGAVSISSGLKVFGTPGTEDITILRTRGQFGAVSSLETLGTNQVQVAVGLGLCTIEAAAAGAVPLPFDNPDWDGWYFYKVANLIGNPGGAGLVYQANMEIDSKAMRKIQAGMVPFTATQMFTSFGAGGFTVNQTIQFRTLIKTS